MFKMEKQNLKNNISANDSAKTLINIPEIKELINKLNDVTNQQDYDKAIINIPDDKPILQKILFKAVAKKTGFTLKEIKKRYNELHNPPKVESDTTGSYLTMSHWILRLRTRYPNKEFIQYDKKIIEMTKNKIYLLTQNKYNPNIPFRDTVAGFNIKIISKCEDPKKDSATCYTFTANKKRFYNFPVMEFLKINEYKLIDKILATKVIKFIFDKKEEIIPSKKAIHTTGFKHGWYIPFENELISMKQLHTKEINKPKDQIDVDDKEIKAYLKKRHQKLKKEKGK